MANRDVDRCEPHDEAEELLPWYATGQLSQAERCRVETHLSSCSQCREQLAIERRLVQEFRAIVPEVESGWSRLRARIESPQPLTRRRGPTMFADAWSLLTRPAVLGLAAAQLVVLLVGAGVLISLSRPLYHTLGSVPAPASANVLVMFRPQATVATVDKALTSTGASVVGGPTAAHAYLLHVAPQQRRAAVARLQSNRDVQLAQPIDGENP